MTEITVYRSRGRIAGFKANGHTGYAESGEDIVCSAVSALTQTAIMGLTEHLGLRASHEIKEGSLTCMLDKSISNDEWKSAEIILETMLLGLKSIEGNYCGYLRLTEREV
ncbi:MAG: ribosomal-processing cysteine protease Prp [Candidatus Gastranaerophilaceae bacterium]|mgnify:FL=1|nr:ribosomal-processing cysteine protease Prp [Christensenellales bacterium]